MWSFLTFIKIHVKKYLVKFDNKLVIAFICKNTILLLNHLLNHITANRTILLSDYAKKNGYTLSMHKAEDNKPHPITGIPINSRTP